MRKTVFSIIALFIGAALSAQPINRSTPEANLKAAQEAEGSNNPYEALEKYEKVYDDTKDKAISIKLAKLNFDLRDYAAAEKSLSRIVNRDRKNEYIELKYWLGLSLKYNGKYPEAVDMLTLFISETDNEALKVAAKREIAGCELARKAKQPENLTVANIGKKANSPQTESSPSYNNSELYYSSLNTKDIITLDGKEGDWYAKIFTSTKAAQEGAEFNEPEPLGTQINREGYHQGNVSVTPDGLTMYFTRVITENMGIKESKIFWSKKGSDGWGAANEASGVNGDFVAKHPCEGELFGEKVLFFVANIAGGKGGDDIYYAPKKGDGAFGPPVNLGAVVNTAGDEASPFYRDGKLFFSSNGRPTFGGMDVFESQWNGSVWSEPKGLPMGINSSVDDIYYTQATDGMSGFLVSNRPGPNNLKSKTCCDDIYAWELARIKVDLIAKTFRLKRKGEKENQPLKECTIQMFDVSDKNPVSVEAKTNPAGNDFAFGLSVDKSYMLVATRNEYQSDTVRFNTTGIKKSTTVEKKLTLRLQKKEPKKKIIKRNEPIRLDNILYDFDKWDIRPDAEPDLQALTNLLLKYPDMKIELSSHTDCRGNDQYNETLSQKRAESATSWIIAKGIAADRIVPKGYGEKVLLNGCSDGVTCTEEEHQLNRRTEFKIISGPTSIEYEEEVIEDPEGNEKPKQTPGGKQSVRSGFFFKQ